MLNNDDIIKIMKTVYAPQKKKIRSIKLQEIVDFSLGISSRFKMDINLRDILRWVDVTISLKCNILDHLPLIITDRIDSLKKDEDYVIYLHFNLNYFVLIIILNIVNSII